MTDSVLVAAEWALVVAAVCVVDPAPADFVVVTATFEVCDDTADEVLVVILLLDADAEAVIVAFELAVPLFTSVNWGVKLYPSGPTLDTFDAGPTMICTA